MMHHPTPASTHSAHQIGYIEQERGQRGLASGARPGRSGVRGRRAHRTALFGPQAQRRGACAGEAGGMVGKRAKKSPGLEEGGVTVAEVTRLVVARLEGLPAQGGRAGSTGQKPRNRAHTLRVPENGKVHFPGTTHLATKKTQTQRRLSALVPNWGPRRGRRPAARTSSRPPSC